MPFSIAKSGWDGHSHHYMMYSLRKYGAKYVVLVERPATIMDALFCFGQG